LNSLYNRFFLLIEIPILYLYIFFFNDFNIFNFSNIDIINKKFLIKIKNKYKKKNSNYDINSDNYKLFKLINQKIESIVDYDIFDL
jgi:hypothetical protein